MNGSVRSRWVLIGGVALLVLGLAGFALPGRAPSPPLRIFYANAGGAVLFPHAGHEKISCAECHHEQAGGAPRSCLICHHEGSFELTDWEDDSMAEVHAELVSAGDLSSCLGCHAHADLIKPLRAASRSSCAQCHDSGLPELRAGHGCAGCHAVDASIPVSACRSCHQTGEGEAKSCDSCHGGSGYERDMMGHAELAAIEGHTCSSCHVATRHADAVHHGCNRCHLDLEKGAFFARSREDASTVCGTCHMKH
ncbi:MAG: hypothetical protein FJY75_10215 [Candidatus Eisenbacteria bacterium]|uniref:Class III cytochrome C domain-containing protein n=1 Tax=Eiseniibacteriota bacterium TaxID=2212470 RepID=A0A938BMN3_UNCEI|nr:hypothetical protein [Candidatus Eisenbacteria bacterium]